MPCQLCQWIPSFVARLRAEGTAILLSVLATACLSYGLAAADIGPTPPPLRIRIDPGHSGDVVIEWDDPEWRLQATDTLPAQRWLSIGSLGETSYRFAQPMANHFFRLGGPCVLPTQEALPVQATTADAPFARRGPLPAHPTQLAPDQQGRIGGRFQQVWFRPFSKLVRIRAITFRLDGNTPRSGYQGDLTWSLALRLGTTPLSPQQLQPAFDANLQNAQTFQVYRGFIVLAGTGQGPGPTAPPQDFFPSQAAQPGDLVRIKLSTPIDYNPAQGNLFLDMRVDGVNGDDFEVLFDAAQTGNMASLWSQQGPTAPIGQPAPFGAVVLFDVARQSPLPSIPALADRCLDSLGLPSNDAEELLNYLTGAQAQFAQGNLPALGQSISNYLARVTQFEQQGKFSPDAARTAQALGQCVGVGLRAGPALFERMAGHMVGAGFGFPFFRKPGALLNMGLNAYQYAPAMEREAGLARQDELITLTDRIFADGVITQADQHDYDQALTNLCETVEKLQKLDNVPEVWKQVFRDLKTVFTKQGPFISALASIASIFEDGKIDINDRGALRSLKSSLDSIIDCLESDGEVRELGDGLLKLICQLLESVVSGDLVRISGVTLSTGKTYLYVKVTESVELRLLQFYIPKELLEGFPIDIPIGLDITVKKDITITTCPIADNDGKNIGADIVFDPPDALDLDIDLDIPFAVEILEKETGIPDLDHFCIKSIKIVNKKLVIEGKSGGKDVRIEVDGGTTTIFVDGKKTFSG